MNRNQFLALLGTIQSQGMSPIQVQIGHVGPTNQVRHDSVLITEAPPAALHLIRQNGDRKNLVMSLGNGGLTITGFESSADNIAEDES